MPQQAIQTEGLTKYYGSVRGVEDLDLEVQDGEVYGFLGPNGAGKTTTLRLLLDLLRPDRGRASIFGLDVRRGRSEIHRWIGYLPGELAMWPELSGRENLEYLARLRGGVDRDYLGELLDRFELDTSKRFRAYSHGNKQKLGLIQAFMHRPRLLLLDEPTSGLDPLVQDTFYALVREVVLEGATVFLSSHVLSEVERVCDRAGIIREGRLVQAARVDDLLSRGRHLVRLTFRGRVDPALLMGVPGVLQVGMRGDGAEGPLGEGEGYPGALSTVTLTLTGDPRPLLERSLELGLVDLEIRRPSLDELFLTYYEESPSRVEEPQQADRAGDRAEVR